jgi:hypothetical protein
MMSGSRATALAICLYFTVLHQAFGYTFSYYYDRKLMHLVIAYDIDVGQSLGTK